jgi:hypothetical protein
MSRIIKGIPSPLVGEGKGEGGAGSSPFGIHTPIMYLICMSQCVARNLAPSAHVVQFLMGCTKARLNITQTFPVRELCKSHAEKLLPAGKVLDFVVAIVPFNTLIEFIRQYKVHELRKYCLPRVHTPSPSALARKYGLHENSISNRKMLNCLVKLYCSHVMRFC